MNTCLGFFFFSFVLMIYNRIVRRSDYSPTIALSEDKDIFRGITLFEKLMVHNNSDVDLVSDNVYTKFG